MSAPRTPADTYGMFPDQLGAAYGALETVLASHRVAGRGEGRGRLLDGDELLDTVLGSLAVGERLTRDIGRVRLERCVTALASGASLVQVAAACERSVDVLAPELLAEVDAQERVNVRDSRYGLSPAAADELRALINGAVTS